jgi:serine/threonine-protein kinase
VSAESEVVLRGELSNTSLVELLKTIEASGQDSLVQLVSETHAGWVAFQNGRLFDAALGDHRGEEAVVRLLGMTDGRFAVSHPRVQGSRSIHAEVLDLVHARERRLRRWSDLLARAPSLNAALGIDADAYARHVDAHPLDPLGRAVVDAVDGERQLVDVIAASGLDPVEALEQLVLLAHAGVVAELSTAAPRAEKSGAASPRAESPPQRPRGLHIGRYEILCPIGRGGMGRVYLCRSGSEGGFQRLFALKRLDAELSADPAFVERFLEEAKLAARLDHPKVVTVLDAATDGGRPYFVMPYVEGASLHAVLQASPGERPPELILPIVIDALEGLHAAHSLTDERGTFEGLVHCDVSPDNLLVGIDGVCRISDFGVAQTRYLLVPPDEARGKPTFVSPELVRRQPLDARSDVFVMGAVLYTALTGVSPFAAASPEECLERVTSGVVTPPSRIGLAPPACFDDLILSALAQDRKERPRTAEQFATELRRIAVREDLLAPASEVGRWIRQLFGTELERRRLATLDASRPTPRPIVFSPAKPQRGPARSAAPSIRSRAAQPRLAEERLLPRTELLPATRVLGARPSQRREAWLVVGAVAVFLGLLATFAWGDFAPHGARSPSRASAAPSQTDNAPVKALSGSSVAPRGPSDAGPAPLPAETKR